MPAVRAAAVAGTFYPADPAALRRTVAELLDVARRRLPDPPANRSPIAALLLPHAGYAYSGSTAALGYAALARDRAAEGVRRVVLLGPTHRVAIDGLALPGVAAFATPLGEVAITPVPSDLRATLPQLVEHRAAHALEHALEVHLPFLQVVLPHALVLPLAVGRAAPDVVAAVLDALVDGPETLVVISSDLSHYHPHDEAEVRDRATVAQIRRLQPPLTHEQACGATPANGLLALAQRRGWEATLLGRCTSGDTAGDRRRVVGYAAVAFG